MPSTEETQLLDFYHKISGIILTCTSFINFTLIYLTIFHAPNLFGTYRNFIITFAVFGTLFSCLEFPLKPLLYIEAYSVLIFSLDFSVGPSNVFSTFVLAVFTGFHCSMLSLISIQFLYRYWSISSTGLLFEQSRFSYWILSAFFGGFIWSVYTYEAIFCTDLDLGHLTSHLEENFQLNTNHVNCIKMEVKSFDGQSYVWSSLVYLVIFTALLLVKLFIMLFCGLKMACQVYKRSSFQSSRHHKQHSLFLKSIFIQILTPILILYLPTFILSYLPFMKSTDGTIIPILTVYPFLDSLIVLNIISDYKTALQNAYNRVFWFIRNERKQEEAPINMSNLFSSI